MGKADFQGSINAWLRNTGDRACGAGGSAVRIHRMYVDDIVRRLGKLHGNSKIELAVAIYIADQDTGSDRVEPAKNRGGLFVVADSDFILARDLSWGRTKYGGYSMSDFVAESITFKPKGKDDGPGVRLRHVDGEHSFALGLWYVGTPRPNGMQTICDRMIELVNEAVIA